MLVDIACKITPLLHYAERATGNRRRLVVCPGRKQVVARQPAHEWMRPV